MDNQNNVKLKRVLGFNATYGAAMGLVVSGTAMFSVTQVAGQSSYAVWITGIFGLIPIVCAALAFSELSSMLPGGGMISDYTNPALGRFGVRLQCSAHMFYWRRPMAARRWQ